MHHVQYEITPSVEGLHLPRFLEPHLIQAGVVFRVKDQSGRTRFVTVDRVHAVAVLRETAGNKILEADTILICSVGE